MIGTAFDALKKGRERLERFGWIQNDLGGPTRGFCAIGALCWTGNEERFNPEGLQEVIDLLSAVVDATGPFHSIVTWNNGRRRKRREVLAAFDAAMSLALDGADPAEVP